MHYICHLWVDGSSVWDVLIISYFLCFVGRDSIVGVATSCEPARGCGIYHPPLFRSEVKESVELYQHSSCRPWMPVVGLNYVFLLFFLSVWGQGSVVSIVTVPLAGWSWVHILVEAKGFSLLQNIQTSSGAHTAFYIWVLGFFPRIKAIGMWR